LAPEHNFINKEIVMNKNFQRQLLNGLGLIIALAVNALATLLPLNGLNTAQISDRFPVLIVPAGYVFSIWGVIYLGLIAFTFYQALPGQRENPRLQKLGLWFFFSCLANALWLVSFHYLQFGLAMVIMLVLLGILIRIYILVGIGKEIVKPVERWLVNLPFSIYLGWITVAAIANAAQLLFSLNWNGFGITAEVWTLIMLAAAVIISALVSFTRRDVGYSLVLVWAFAGIAFKQSALTIVSGAAWIAAAAVVIFLMLAIVLKPVRTK
jgi:benzodiazapine receptor